ncbi:MAG: hypothetical protein BWY13_01577 [Euryarchaeota archaeon ADurb.Bin190]|jgi:hypothetical protein|nr:MAG: hypothetical protein BWY13_01577 [Euryarchaeota archaeon ADurb.Bin190]HNU39540.1 hypothetical protein [Methanothrix sp.]HPM26270.1 hypothetical protein [Methanothrix sp.]
MATMGKATSKAAILPKMGLYLAILALGCTMLFPAAAEHYVMEIGSKSNPNAHLFAYDQKFRESTRLQNAPMKMVASKEFTDATRLSTSMALKMEPNLTQMNIEADFIGIGRIDYLVYNPESDVAAGEVKERDVMSRINHMFVGNFSIEEQILVAKGHMCEDGYLPCA